MSKSLLHSAIAIVFCGLGMWVLAGLWHNLILPNVNHNIHPHHEGIGIMFISYIVLSFFMTYFYLNIKRNRNYIFGGLWLGIIIGIVWVFPHGLAMAAAHGTSMVYEFKNTAWHIFEQGTGGTIIALIIGKSNNANT